MKSILNILNLFKNLWFTFRFFVASGIIFIVLALGFVQTLFLSLGQGLLVMLAIAVVFDFLLLYSNRNPFTVRRTSQKLLSNGDNNTIKLYVKNETKLQFEIEIYDELPEQLQKRDFHFGFVLIGLADKLVSYTIQPKERGSYLFGNVNVFFSTKVALLKRRQIIPLEQEIPVYPSIIQMKKFELKALEKASHFYGIKKLRRLGQSYEFEQIRSYVKGDDYRKINWKATSKINNLMVNQYTEEKSQMVYCILDKSRNMKLPFYGLSLLDYAINSSLVLSNVSLQKQDKAGLITFSDKMDAIIPAGNKSGQLRKILENLYLQTETYSESNYELLYSYTKKIIPNRSLLFLFTNFENPYNLDRNIQILRKLNKIHLLVVIFFENTELTHYLEKDATSVQDIYQHTIAEKFKFDKLQMMQKLKQYGIQSIYTKPEDLTVNSINKYLEIKARGLI